LTKAAKLEYLWDGQEQETASLISLKVVSFPLSGDSPLNTTETTALHCTAEAVLKVGMYKISLKNNVPERQCPLV